MVSKSRTTQQGDINAQNNLGTMYKDGNGVPQDYKQAFELFKKAAQKGEATAQYNLGIMYIKGQGVSQDYIEAKKYFIQAEQGFKQKCNSKDKSSCENLTEVKKIIERLDEIDKITEKIFQLN